MSTCALPVATEVPTIIVILGATGDLSQKKLIPALFDLYAKGQLPESCSIVGFSRGSYTDAEFREFMRLSIKTRAFHRDRGNIDAFLLKAFYHRGNFDEPGAYARLADFLKALTAGYNQCPNRLFYLAVPPRYYEGIFRNLAASGLSEACSDDEGWTRVLVEKPFGRDIDTARSLDRMLGELFREEQIFRIDHYLARETLQNILIFRFANTIFEPVWSRDYVEKVEISMLETIDVGMRGAFYEDIGALRDVGQNHMLQMLALITMEHPGVLDVSNIRRERARVFASLLKPKPDELGESVIRGQYAGFTQEKNVAPESKTETYFRMKTFLDNDRWRGVPFYLESGKALGDKKAEITIFFREAPPCLCPDQPPEGTRNVLCFRIQPDEGIDIRFWAKKPGLEATIEPRDFKVVYDYGSPEKADAYERVLYDCIKGDQTLFVSTDEVRAAWEYISEILYNWDSLPLHIYEKGSAGPASNWGR